MFLNFVWLIKCGGKQGAGVWENTVWVGAGGGGGVWDAGEERTGEGGFSRWRVQPGLNEKNVATFHKVL